MGSADTRRLACAVGAALALALAGCGSGGTPPGQGIQKIKHVVVIMQENRSFDSYFGTYPGADGIPMHGGVPTVCVPNPAAGTCVRPFHDGADRNAGGPHGDTAATADINGGRMNGFIAQQLAGRQRSCLGTVLAPTCSLAAHGLPDVMGYKDQREIPNYWAYARNFVLQDHMFEANASWSLPQHLFMVSEWSARCSNAEPSSCVNALQAPGIPPDFAAAVSRSQGQRIVAPNYAWTDLTYLLHRAGVSWGYYVFAGLAPDCANNALACAPAPQSASTPGIWNPLPYFETVRQNQQLGNIKDLASFYREALAGTLPAVSWIAPTQRFSEHPPASTAAGQAYVTTLINAVMQGPAWNSTAIFVSWDDWGGFYDHVAPPRVDRNGYGLRVPGLLISPYAKSGYIDHQTLSFDAYARFIEDAFLGGQRLNPANDGRPDPRPTVRETAPALGNLVSEFDFNQAPRPPIILPATGPVPAVAPPQTVVEGTAQAAARRRIARRARRRALQRRRALRGGVGVVTSVARVSAGAVGVRLACRRRVGVCAGTLTLDAAGIALGSAPFAIPMRRRATVRVPLTGPGLQLLRAQRRLQVTATAGGASASVTISVR